MLLRLRVVACAQAIPDRILFAVRKYILACIPRVSNHLAFIHSGRQHRNSRRRFVHACAKKGDKRRQKMVMRKAELLALGLRVAEMEAQLAKWASKAEAT